MLEKGKDLKWFVQIATELNEMEHGLFCEEEVNEHALYWYGEYLKAIETGVVTDGLLELLKLMSLVMNNTACKIRAELVKKNGGR